MADEDDDLDLDDIPGPQNQNGASQDDEQEDQPEQQEEVDQDESEQEGEVDASPDRRQSQQQEEQQERRQPSRGERRFAVLTEQVRQRDRELAELRGRMDAFLQQRDQPRGETPEQRAQRLATLTPEERITETLNVAQYQFQQQLSALQLQTADQTDRASFEAKCAVDKVRAKYRDAVEDELAKARREGKTAPRDVVYYYLLGKAVDERRGGPENRQQRRAAARRVERQEVRPRGTRSDTQAERRQSTSLERRLENQPI